MRQQRKDEHLDSVIPKDLEFLKQQNWPFTKAKEVEQFF